MSTQADFRIYLYFLSLHIHVHSTSAHARTGIAKNVDYKILRPLAAFRNDLRRLSSWPPHKVKALLTLLSEKMSFWPMAGQPVTTPRRFRRLYAERRGAGIFQIVLLISTVRCFFPNLTFALCPQGNATSTACGMSRDNTSYMNMWLSTAKTHTRKIQLKQGKYSKRRFYSFQQ